MPHLQTMEKQLHDKARTIRLRSFADLDKHRAELALRDVDSAGPGEGEADNRMADAARVAEKGEVK
jgi:hypothetical protein